MYLLFAAILEGGILRLVRKDDVPYGIAQISVVVVAALLALVSNRRMAQRLILAALALVVIGCGIAEIVSGNKIRGILAMTIVIPIVILMRVYGKRQRKPKDTAKS